MKYYKQVYLLAKDRGFSYELITNSPNFHNEGDALKYWEINKNRILDSNFYNDPIVVIRREVNNSKTKDLYDGKFTV